MTAKKRGLQKLTETERKINSLLEKKQLFAEDIARVLSKEERPLFSKILTKRVNESKGIERDELINKIETFITDDIKNQFWENNHAVIIASMTRYIDEYGQMPTKTHISNDTGLSRQTIYKHLAGYSDHPLYAEQLRQFKFMADKVLAKVIKMAGQGDIKAARLYFDVMGNLNGQTKNNNTLINTQNNNIQINGMVLSQETVKQLSPDQLKQIETVLQSVLSEKK